MVSVVSPITRDDVVAAAGRIHGRVHRTPTLSSTTLGERVWLKAELLQKTGSFKVRGVLNKLASLTPEERERGVIGVSAGNHAQALAWGAAVEGLDALVVMWQSASAAKIAATRGYGATVDLGATGPGDAFDRLHELVEETGRTLVHPFDDPLVQAGQGTVGLEVLEDAPEAETILVPAGGGGLVAGIAAAAVPEGRRVVAVEPELSTAVLRRACGRALGPCDADLDRRRPLGPLLRRERPRGASAQRRREHPRERAGDRGRVPVPL